MKGFVRIFEAIIASMILLSSLTYFIFITKYSGWGDAQTQLQIEDSIASLGRSGLLNSYIKSNDIASINNKLRQILPKTTDFSIEVSGIPNPQIYIGCVCTDSERSALENMLSPLNFNYKGRNIEIRVSPVSFANIDPKTNIIFVYGYKDLTSNRTDIDKFLENGTLVMLGNLSSPLNDVMTGIFGLAWKGGTPSAPASSTTRASGTCHTG